MNPCYERRTPSVLPRLRGIRALTPHNRNHSTTAEPSVGELRFIARLSRSTLPNGPTVATIFGNSGAIEGSDVFMVNGQTRSKCTLVACCSLGGGADC